MDGARAVVVGVGVSGEAAARLLRRQGANVLAMDTRVDVNSSVAADLRDQGVELRLGVASVDLANADLVVVSPGVPNEPWLCEAARRGVRIVSELELASWYVDAEIIAVGGTNGKSTTTELTALLAATTGRAVFAGGNLGVPLSRAVVDGNAGVQLGGIAVVEVSSFQLERVSGFAPAASILLNVTPDHLDRYPSFEAYAAAKGGAFRAQTARDVAIVPYGDSLCARVASLGAGRLEQVDGPSPATLGVETRQATECIVDRVGGVALPRSALRLSGRHNVTNLCAAWAAVRSIGGDPARFESALGAFTGLAHRTAWVASLDGVNYYDDSKGTNVAAVVTAVSGLPEKRVVLIAGGRDKGGAYEPLVDALRKNGRALVAIGEAGPAIESAARSGLGAFFPVERAKSMDDAVDIARRLALPGDAVLLSPACSSFDMFRDYKHRGDAFVAAVAKLKGGRS